MTGNTQSNSYNNDRNKNNYTLQINSANRIEDEDGIDNTHATGSYNGTSYTDHDDSLVNNGLKFSIPVTYTGSGHLTYNIQSSITVGSGSNAHTFTITNTGNGTFSLNPAQFQYLNAGQAVKLAISVTVNDGCKSVCGITYVTIVGTNDNQNHCPVVKDVCYQDDEDGLNTVSPSDTLVNTKLVFAFSGTDQDGDALTYTIKQGTYTIDGKSYTVTLPNTINHDIYLVKGPDGKQFSVHNLGNGKFELSTSEYQYLNQGQTETIAFKYSVTDGHGNCCTGDANATIKIYGTSDNHCPVVKDVCVQDDEDGLNTVAPNDTLVNGKLVFGFNASDADGDALTYHIQTGTYSLDGQTYTIQELNVGPTPGSVTYKITNNGQSFTLLDQGNGKFELLTSEFQYLNAGQSRTLEFNYTAIDNKQDDCGCGDHSGKVVVKIFGTNDSTLVASNQTFIDDEDAVDGTGASAVVNGSTVTDHDDGIPGTLQFTINNYTHTGPGAVTLSGIPATALGSDGHTYAITNNGNGIFSVNKADFQYLNAGQAVTLTFNYTVSADGLSSTAQAKVIIIGTNDNSLVASSQTFIDDEDAVDGTGASAVVNGSTVADHDDGIPGTLQFAINNYTHVGPGAVTFSGIPASALGSDGHTYNIVNNGNGIFSVNKADFQYLAVGQAVTLSFNYTVSADGLSSSALAKVIIIGTNDGIDAIDDNLGTINAGASVSANILANDIDPENEDLDVSSINSLVINGVTIAPAQWSLYFVTNNETGVLQFNSSNMNVPAGTSQNVVINYTATDPHGATDSANVFIKVQGSDVHLLAVEDTFVEDEDAIDGTGATSAPYTDHDDGNPAGSLRFQISDASYNGSGTLTYSGIPATVTGSDGHVYNVTTLPNHQFSFNTADFQHLTVGERVEFNVTYTVSDGTLSRTATEHVIIIGTNDGIDAIDDNLGTINAGSSTSFNILANDIDPENEDLDVSSINSLVINGVTIAPAQWSQYFTVNNETGLLNFNSAAMSVAAGTSQNVVINYTATDPHGATDSANVFVTVKGPDVNLVASNQKFVDDEDAVDGTGATAVVNAVLETDHDDGNPGTLQFHISNYTYNGSGTISYSGVPASILGSDGLNYSVTNNGNGTFTLDKAAFNHLAVGQAVTLTFNYTVSDGTLSSTAQAKVIIIGTNDGIDAIDDNLGTINAGSSTSFNILANDIDPEHEDLDVSSINSLVINGVTIAPAQWSQYFTVNNETGLLNFNSSSMTVAAGTSQNVVINYTAVDPHGATDSANVFLTVKGPDVRIIAADAQFVEDEDAIDGTGAHASIYTDHDDGNPAGQLAFQLPAPSYNGSSPITYSGIPTSVLASDGNSYAVINLGNGKFSIDKAAFQHLPQDSFVTFTFIYTVTAGALSDTAEAKVVIIGTNDAPVAIDDHVGTIVEGTTVDVAAMGNDFDPDGDPIHITKVNSITIDGVLITDPTIVDDYVTILPNNHLYVNTSTIDKDHDFDIVINYEITDPYGLTDTANVFINVDNVTRVIYYGDNENDGITVQTGSVNAQDATLSTAETVSGVTRNYTDNTAVHDDADAYGDLGTLALRVIAGNATAFASPASTGGTEYATAETDATITESIFNFGDDNLTQNRGLVVGDAGTVLLFGHQGNAAANFDINCFNPTAEAHANVSINNVTMNFGDDSLKIGNGIAIGDVQKLQFTYENGTASGNGTTFDNDDWNHNNTFNFGNDVIQIREGVATGDLATAVVNGVTYDLSVAAQLAAFQATTAYTENTFHFGSDTFKFDTNEFFNVKVNDFGIGGVADKLEFTGTGINTLAQLTAHSNVVNNGGHAELQVDTNNDGTIDSHILFANTNFVAGHVEITDYVNSGDILFS